MPMTTEEASRLRTKLNFEIKHSALGGSDKLMELIREHKTLSHMATYFGESPQGMSYVIKKLLGTTYERYLNDNGVKRHGVSPEVQSTERYTNQPPAYQWGVVAVLALREVQGSPAILMISRRKPLRSSIVPLRKTELKKRGKVTNALIAQRRQWVIDNPPDWRGYYPPCPLCLIEVHISEMELDHIKERSTNPELRYTKSNLRPVHAKCNQDRKRRERETAK
jgi:5-methylcytosine-specific restriction endonuclease McrA